MEMSSPLAAMHPPPMPGNWGLRRDLQSSLFAQYPGTKNFNFRDLSMKSQSVDYFNMPPMRGSSPTASLAADMSSNLHMDQRYCRPCLPAFLLSDMVPVHSSQHLVGHSSLPTSSNRWTIEVSTRTISLARVPVLIARSSNRSNYPTGPLGRRYDAANSFVLALRPRRLDGHLASAPQSPLQLHLRAYPALAEPCHHSGFYRRRYDLAMRGAASAPVPCTATSSGSGAAAGVCCWVSSRLRYSYDLC
jgi:hypothetical protein